MRLAFAVVIVTAAAAHAEPPSRITVTAGAGIAMTHLADEISGAGFTSGVSFRLDAAYSVRSDVAVGIHGGLLRAQAEGWATEQDITYGYNYSGVEVGVTAQLVFDRFWAAPWIGISKLDGPLDLGTTVNTVLGYGFAIGYGIYALAGNHYVDVFVSGLDSPKVNPIYVPGPGSAPPTVSFTTFTVGLDYRY
jgi:hypothetical protein